MDLTKQNKETKLIKNLIKTTLSKAKDILSYNIKINMGDEIINYSFLETDYAKFLKTTSISEIKETLDLLDEYYYDGNPLVSDNVYDIISDYYYQKTGGDKSSKIGHSLATNIVKTKLPITCTSLDKVKPGQTKLTSFLKKYTDSKWVSSKLDGNSLLIGRRNGTPKAFTRGDGTYGQDVSHILNFIKGDNGETLYSILNNSNIDNFYIRGEIIISKANWKKNKHIGSNARNVVAGLTHHKNLSVENQQLLSSIVDFLGYEFIVDNSHKIKPKYTIESQFNKIIEMNIKTPNYGKYENSQVTEDSLPQLLADYREISEYEIDGIVIENNVYNPRYKSGNPKYAKAFKMEMYNDTGVAKIIDIDWTITKSGKLKPTLIIPPTIINEVKIERIYAYNARNVLDLKLGIGSTIEIIRSGDVIPKVKTVIDSKFNEKTDFPDKKFSWDENNVDIIIDDDDDESVSEITLRQIEYFIKTTGIEFIKIGTIKKFYDVGISDIFSYIGIQDTNEMLKADGIKSKSANKMYNSIVNTLTNIEPHIFAASLPVFGNVGRKRMKLIFDNIPNFTEIETSQLETLITNIEGFSNKTAKKIIDGISEYVMYRNYYENKYGELSYKNEKVNSSQKLEGMIFCFSGVRSKDTESIIVKNGGEVSSSFSKKVTHLIVKDKGNKTSKIVKAEKQGSFVIELADFPTLLQ